MKWLFQIVVAFGVIDSIDGNFITFEITDAENPEISYFVEDEISTAGFPCELKEGTSFKVMVESDGFPFYSCDKTQ